ncbi:peptide/nickel transport system permease protein [Natranaerovirga hydrolytica]|uniref:Peptide/nickel transport system permease protein n=1 Tax=Natranaerovirga hydrolytica TaxID=680378 RepID=A0A4R1MDF3_9FIRM|nr:ABC transporter permease [Natranaerovirga hydrolytica]TCK87873.1 peptide/nickel transport system permease protein [Natranaerovirga hydrolytica]
MVKNYALTVIIIVSIIFFLPRLMPGDPFTNLSVEDGEVSVRFTQEQINQYKSYYGLDEPLYKQYFNYIIQLSKGHLGFSIYYNMPVKDIIFNRLGWTFFMVMVSLIISSILGIVLGSIAAFKKGTRLDNILYGGMVVVSESPAFLIGILLLFLFAAHLKWFPLSGGITPFATFDSPIKYLGDVIRHGFLPIGTLVISRVGNFFLLTRSSMLVILSKNYLVTAKAKGLKRKRIVFKHALKNALIPILTRILMSMGGMFGGAILVENVFAYPGVGRLMREAVMVRDYILVQGIFLIIMFLVLMSNILAEILYQKIDPRVDGE